MRLALPARGLPGPLIRHGMQHAQHLRRGNRGRALERGALPITAKWVDLVAALYHRGFLARTHGQAGAIAVDRVVKYGPEMVIFSRRERRE